MICRGCRTFSGSVRNSPTFNDMNDPPPFVDAVTYERKLLYFHIYIIDSNICILIIPSNLKVTQKHTKAPKLCLQLFSAICLMIKSRLNLKRKNKEFCNTACAGDTENFDSLLNLKYFIQAVKFR